MVTAERLNDGRTYLRIGLGPGLRLILRPRTANAALDQLQREGRMTLPATRDRTTR
jgi:hypothetical protein